MIMVAESWYSALGGLIDTLMNQVQEPAAEQLLLLMCPWARRREPASSTALLCGWAWPLTSLRRGEMKRRISMWRSIITLFSAQRETDFYIYDFALSKWKLKWEWRNKFQQLCLIICIVLIKSSVRKIKPNKWLRLHYDLHYSTEV